jgi:EAL domain-containing protein (putative c-di-GMP-specific phosphodiesterase class I)
VRAVIGLGNSLGISVTAEGVETEAQATYLAKEACTELQGYLFSKAIPAKDILVLLEPLRALADACEPVGA